MASNNSPATRTAATKSSAFQQTGSTLVSASAKGHGQIQQQFQGDPETNRTELAPFVLQLANCVLAGQVLNENDKPVSGAMVQITGNGQPSENVTTDSKGRFHFQVCEGQVQLFANSPKAAVSPKPALKRATPTWC